MEKGENLFNVTGIDLNNSSGNDKINKINSGTFPFETKDRQLINETKKCIEQGSLVQLVIFPFILKLI